MKFQQLVLFCLSLLIATPIMAQDAANTNQAYEYFNEAIGYFKARDFKKAVVYYSKAIDVNPEYTKAYYNRGSAKLNVKDYEGAIRDFDRVLEERQNFDPVGHYSRPDVTKLTVNRERQSTVEFKD